jgi:hypothetical protein
VLQARKPYLLNLPCTDKRLASIFQLTLHPFFFFLALVPLSSHNRPSLQNAVVQGKKKPRRMMASLLQYSIIGINRGRKKKLKHKIL